MPLHDASGRVADPWVRLDPGQTAPADARVILDFARLEAEGPPPAAALGAHVPPDQDPRALIPWHARLALISVAFPSFADGRGFSLARRIRATGFRGELRATGPVIADQFPALLGVGFDTVEIPEALAARQPEADWKAALAVQGLAYQPGFSGRDSILEARRAARRAAQAAGA